MGVGSGLYMYDVVVKRLRSLSHLLMSSCHCCAAVKRYHNVEYACMNIYPRRLRVLLTPTRQNADAETQPLRRKKNQFGIIQIHQSD